MFAKKLLQNPGAWDLVHLENQVELPKASNRESLLNYIEKQQTHDAFLSKSVMGLLAVIASLALAGLFRELRWEKEIRRWTDANCIPSI